MVETKSLDATRRAWEGAIGSVPAKYSEGVNAARDVIAKGVAAEQLYADRVQETIASRKRAENLSKVTDQEWKNAALTKGAPRIATGMSASKEKFARGISEVLTTLQGITLPPRTADVMANVTNRVGKIATELHEKFK